MTTDRNPQQRAAIHAGLVVDIIQKNDQRTGKRTRGIVEEILTTSGCHPHGIKVRLKDGHVGRVAEIIGPGATEGNDTTGR